MGRREGQKAGGATGADKTAAHRFGLSRIIVSPSTKEKKNEHNGRKFQILAKNYETFLSSKLTISVHTSNQIQVTTIYIQENNRLDPIDQAIKAYIEIIDVIVQ